MAATANDGVANAQGAILRLDRHLLARRDIATYLRDRQIPARDESGAETLWRFGDDQTATARIRTALEQMFSESLVEEARSHLRDTQPAFSAYKRLSQSQAVSFSLIAGASGVLALVRPEAAWIAANLVFLGLFAPSILIRLYAFSTFRTISARSAASRAAPPQNREVWPFYTILVALYRERLVLPQLTRALSALDYPSERLDIKLILEEDDEETCKALSAIPLPDHFHVLTAPACAPRTKPKALNYGLAFALGEYVAIYDAEDIPDADQLKKAARIFRTTPPEIACLQARLTVYNGSRNWLTRQFDLEYAMHFRAILPALERLGWPLPLGGTSNHFRIRALRQVGGWDPYNVTEDADLGLRLARFGYKSCVIDSDTHEESTANLRDWRRQRARWLKGFMQTLLVLTRDPVRSAKRVGPAKFAGACLFLSGSLISSFAFPLAAGVLTLRLALDSDGAGELSALLVANVTAFGLGATSTLALGLRVFAARSDKRKKGRVTTVMTAPAYRFYAVTATVLACRDFLLRPHHWRKTPHTGLTLLT